MQVRGYFAIKAIHSGTERNDNDNNDSISRKQKRTFQKGIKTSIFNFIFNLCRRKYFYKRIYIRMYSEIFNFQRKNTTQMF